MITLQELIAHAAVTAGTGTTNGRQRLWAALDDYCARFPKRERPRALAAARDRLADAQPAGAVGADLVAEIDWPRSSQVMISNAASG